ncbi:MAG: hypothetical protein ABJA98_33650 [Acidobacteriota bacterium]
MTGNGITVFVPLIGESRMAAYTPAAFQIQPQVDDGVNIVFTPLEAADAAIFMPSGGEVFFVPAGATVTPKDGPSIVAPADRNVLAVHIVKTYEWAPIMAPTGQPVAEWWAMEGIESTSFSVFVDAQGLDGVAVKRGYANGPALRADVVTGKASVTAMPADASPIQLGSLAVADDATATLGLRVYANSSIGPTQFPAVGALTAFKQLVPASDASSPGLEAHPVVKSALTLSTTLPVTIHVRFVYWSPNTADAGTEVDKGQPLSIVAASTIALQKRTAGASPIYTTIAQAPVVNNGQVALSVARATLQSVNVAAGEGFAFRVDVPAGTVFVPQYQHQQQPREAPVALKWGSNDNAWVTEQRSTTDGAIGSLDFLATLESTDVGSLNQPIVYYVGIPIFLQIQYPVVGVAGSGAGAQFTSTIRKAPKGLLVEIQKAKDIPLGRFRTDEHGQIWGMVATWDPLVPSFSVCVKYEIKDDTLGLGLLPILGEVVEGGITFTETSVSVDAAGKKFLDVWASGAGKPTGGPSALGVAIRQVGTVTIPATPGAAVSDFSSVDGRHAGVLHALQQVRYIHQWFHYLTQGFVFGGADRSWKTVMAEHDGGNGAWPSNAASYKTAVPRVRVTEPIAGAFESRFGEVQALKATTAAGSALAWWLILYGHTTFKMTDTLGGNPIPPANAVQFWRHHTIWHEFIHAVMNMALGLLLDMDAYQSVVNAKDPSTSSRINQAIGDGWSTFEEGLAAVPEMALVGNASGIDPQFHPSATASPRYMLAGIDTNGDGAAEFSKQLFEGMSVPGVLDWRLGLRVPLAFTLGLWTALQRTAGFSTLYSTANYGGPPTGNDLKDKITYLSSADAKRIFQALVWGPLVALRTAQGGTAQQPQWDDLDGSIAGFDVADAEGKGAAGPVFGDPGSRRICINGPSTHRFMELVEQNFWTTLTAAEQTTIKHLFGDRDDAGNPEPTSFYLWFDFKP